MPLLGEFCIKNLGFSMKGYLHRFVGSRNNLFELGDDGRQHIYIKPGAYHAVSVAKKSNANDSSLDSEKKREDVDGSAVSLTAAPDAHVAGDELSPGSSSSSSSCHAIATGTANAPQSSPVKQQQQHQQQRIKRPAEYNKWDRVTQEVFNYVVANGGAVPFKNVEMYMRENWPHLLASAGFPPQLWKCALFTYKRRNIFRKDGNLLALLTMYQSPGSDGMTGQELGEGGDGSTARKHQPGSKVTLMLGMQKRGYNLAEGVGLVGAPTAKSNIAGKMHNEQGSLGRDEVSSQRDPHMFLDQKQRNKSTFSPSSDSPGVDESDNNNANDDYGVGMPGATANASVSFSLVLEDICSRIEDVQRITSDEITDLHRENLGLRAACVTLGRELLTLKEHVAEMKSQLESAGLVQFVRSAPPPTLLQQDASFLNVALSRGFDGDLGHPSLPLDAVAGFLPDTLNDTSTGHPPPPSHQHHGLHHHGSSSHANQSSMTSSLAKGSLTGADQVLLIGGHDGNGWLDSIDVFTPNQSTFNQFKSMPAPRSFCAALSTMDGLFIMGGGDGNSWYDSVMLLPSDGASWKALAPLSDKRGSMAAAMLQNRLHVLGGGRPGEHCLNFVEFYDLGTDRWLPGPELSMPRFALGGAVLDAYNSIYAVGGYDGESYLATVERLDPREGRWTPVTPMAMERGGHACAAHESRIYSIGGYSERAICECEVYDARANAWMPIAELSDCRSYGDAVALSNGDVLAVGGLRGDMQTPSPLLELYSPSRGKWKELEIPLYVSTQSRSFLAACLLNSRN